MLSARQVQVARDGDTHDGEGLILRVQGKGASWVLRYRVASGALAASDQFVKLPHPENGNGPDTTCRTPNFG